MLSRTELGLLPMMAVAGERLLYWSADVLARVFGSASSDFCRYASSGVLEPRWWRSSLSWRRVGLMAEVRSRWLSLLPKPKLQDVEGGARPRGASLAVIRARATILNRTSPTTSTKRTAVLITTSRGWSAFVLIGSWSGYPQLSSRIFRTSQFCVPVRKTAAPALSRQCLQQIRSLVNVLAATCDGTSRIVDSAVLPRGIVQIVCVSSNVRFGL